MSPTVPAQSARPNRVLILVENLPVPFDRRVWQEATTLHAHGWQVSVICITGDGYEKTYEVVDGIYIYRYPLPTQGSGALGYLAEYSAALWHTFRLAFRVRKERGFDVIHAWGFRYKSCLIWIKPQLGMGNYWRVSHEFLLFGVRGQLPFRDNTCRSWQLARRTAHSRKPFLFRGLIEQVSPGPYLELYGREEQPQTDWTVYGNQVERRLF